MCKKNLLLIVNADWFFMSHRLPIALEAMARGYNVHIACAYTDRRADIEQMGLITHDLPLSRSKLGLVGEFNAIRAIRKVIVDVEPDIVHLVTIKPVLYGGMLCRLLGVKKVVAAVSGMGFIYTDRGYKASLLRVVTNPLYRIALSSKKVTVIVQNNDDLGILKRIGALKNSEYVLIPGSGVDLNVYRPSPPVLSRNGKEDITFMFIGRLLKDKGVGEFLRAAEVLHSEAKCSFVVVGDIDDGNPNSLDRMDLDRISRLSYINLMGFCSDVPTIIASADVVVLPSYREGFPKVLIEAAASGKPVIATDVPGCRDAVEVGVTGLLVPARDVEGLVKAMKTLIENDNDRIEMGINARLMAKKRFDIKLVVARHMEVYGISKRGC